jgi:RNA-directed DNA polymerase
LFDLLSQHVRCAVTLNLLWQFLHYSVEHGGNFHQPRRGIPRGFPLSPLLAGFHLFELDRQLAGGKATRYLRFMDDLLILTRTRWQLKRAVAHMNRWFTAAGLQQHPEKTFIGRIARGFAWLGYQFDASGLASLATRALDNHQIKLRRLYEQARRLRWSEEQTQQRVVEYLKRWQRWTTAGLGSLLSRSAYITWANP